MRWERDFFILKESKGEGEVFMEQRIEQLLSQLTLEEKLDMLRTKAKQLNKMNNKLVSILDSKTTEND